MRFIKILLMMLCIFVVLAACENTFEPLKENDQYYFSLYGTIDASADTQWVRVMSVRDSILTSPEPLDATVTLTRKSNGQVIVLKDSLFRLRNNVYAWNYWTTEPVYPGEEYYFEAKNSEGGVSSADLFIPPDYPTPVVDYEQGDQLARIYVEDVDQLVVADIKYYFRSVNYQGEVSDKIYSESFSQIGDVREDYIIGTKIVFAYPREGFQALADKYVTEGLTSIMNVRQEVIIVSGGPGWPDVSDLPEEELFLPGAVSNVDHGLGIVTGVVSKTVPLESCYDNEGNIVACPLLESESLINVKE